MWNSLARSPLVTCLIHDRWLCEKPWMKRISGPFGLPQSCAEMVRPSGVFTETALNFGSCARPGAETAVTRNAAIEIAARLRQGIGWVMGFAPREICVRIAGSNDGGAISPYHYQSSGQRPSSDQTR